MTFGAERSDLAAPVEGRGEAYAVYALPEVWGQGVGHALMSAAYDALREDGFDAVALWVLTQNARATTFYLREGFLPTGDVTEATDHRLAEARYARDL